MGLLSWLNRHGNEILDPIVVDPGFKRADRALEKGAAAGATLVGIEQKLDDGTTTRFVAVAIPTAHGTRTAGVHVMHGPAHVLARLRLGVEVLVRHDDGDAVVLDWPAMCARWGVSDQPAQKRRRKAPEEGVTDKAVDWADQRRLKKWTPRRATITGLSRRNSVMGPSDNFDVALRLDDGAQAAPATPRSRSTPPGSRRPGRRCRSPSTRRTRRRRSSTGRPPRTSRSGRRGGSTTRRRTAAPPRCSRAD